MKRGDAYDIAYLWNIVVALYGLCGTDAYESRMARKNGVDLIGK